MLQLQDRTPFASTILVFPDRHGVDTLLLVAKGTFTISSGLELAEHQVPPTIADEYWGEPGQSSLRYASEAHLPKPSTDVALVGQAWAPGGKKVTQLDVSLEVANKSKRVRVHGNRSWRRSWTIRSPFTPPEPFESMPLVYERAYGGIHVLEKKDKVYAEGRNPVGVGFRGKRSPAELAGLPLPNLEDPEKSLSRPGKKVHPTGFGFIAPSWLPRRDYAGTYDEAWSNHRAPYLPLDFEDRFWNAANPDLICDGYLQGGEPVTVTNASAAGNLEFEIPDYDLLAETRVAGIHGAPIMNLETVLIEPDEDRLCLTWRGAVCVDKVALKTELIRLSLGVKGKAIG